MSLQSTSKLLKAYKPSSLEEIKELGLKLRRISSDESLYRDVYKVSGILLVLKIPHQTGVYNGENVTLKEAQEHSHNEYKAVQRINKFKRYKYLRPLMPKIHYYDEKTGIIGVHYYKPFKLPERDKDLIARLVEIVVESNWDWEEFGTVDVHTDNIAIRDDFYNPVIIDLGYFVQQGK